MPQRREHPYIWATWLPRLLTGENSCEWAIWFKAHYQDWTRQPSDFDQAKWVLDHTALVNEAHQQLDGRRLRRRRRGTEPFRTTRQNRHAGRPTRHHCPPRRRSSRRRRQDRERKPQPRRAGDDLPVRRPQGPPALPERQITGAGNLPRSHRAHSGGGRRRSVHPEPGHSNPQALGRRTREASSVATGMPILRHHGRRLPRAGGRHLRNRDRRNRRLLMAATHDSHLRPGVEPRAPVTPALNSAGNIDIRPHAVAEPTSMNDEMRQSNAAARKPGRTP